MLVFRKFKYLSRDFSIFAVTDCRMRCAVIFLSMIRNIVFDLGGVVIGRDYEAAGQQLHEFAFLRGDQPFPEFWKNYDLGLVGRKEVVSALAADNNISLAQADDKLQLLIEMFNVFPDTEHLIRDLHRHDFRLYVLSNMPFDFYEHVKSFDVFRLFDGQLISSCEKLAKPDPRFFKLLCSRFGFEPESALFVDDKPSNTGVARQLGFHTCTFIPSAEGCRVLKNILIDDGTYCE